MKFILSNNKKAIVLGLSVAIIVADIIYLIYASVADKYPFKKLSTTFDELSRIDPNDRQKLDDLSRVPVLPGFLGIMSTVVLLVLLVVLLMDVRGRTLLMQSVNKIKNAARNRFDNTRHNKLE